MSDQKPIKVTVTDPDTGEVLGECIVRSAYDVETGTRK